MATAAMLIAALTVLSLVAVTNSSIIATYKAANGSVYTIENMDSGEDTTEGLSEESMVKLTQGSFELVLQDGTRCVVSAPAKFILPPVPRGQPSSWLQPVGTRTSPHRPSIMSRSESFPEKKRKKLLFFVKMAAQSAVGKGHGLSSRRNGVLNQK